MTEELKTQDDIQKLMDKFVRPQVVEEYVQTLNAKPPPSIIYHYTDGAGLRGILETGNIWCTDIFNLNDTSEIRHGVAHASELLSTAASAGDATPALRLFAKKVVEELNGHIEESANYFVCCFSSAGDDLGQWRAYADDGRGYAIGFDAGILERAFMDAAPENHSTFPLCYEDEKLRSMQVELVTQARHILSTAAGNINPRLLADLSVRLSVNVIYCSIFFKHHGYSNEQEYRFLQVHRGDLPVNNLKIRSRPYSLIRYCEFDWKKRAAQALKEVVIGPAANPKMASKFVDDCRRTFLSATQSINVKRSEIPYRSNSR